MEGYERRYSFFEGYYRAMAHMSDEQELSFRRAIDRFAFEGEEPEFEDPMLLMAWDLIVSTLAKSLKLSNAGRVGGTVGGRGNKKGAFKGAFKPDSEGLKAGLKGSYEAFKPPFNEGEEEGEVEKRDELARMYSQRVKVVPIGKEAL